MKQIQHLDEFLLNQPPLALVYLSQPSCSVCLADKPRIEKLALAKEIPLYTINVADVPEAAGYFSALTAPVVLLYFQGKERHREARIIDFNRLAAMIDHYLMTLNQESSTSYESLFDQLSE
jgi:thiol-disulfide isomerase/thioredoxin